MATGSASTTSVAPERIRTLRDGTRICLDLLGGADRADLLAGFAGLSRRSRYLRFFSPMGDLPTRILDGLLNTDPHLHVAIGARLLDANDRVQPPIVGVARYFRTNGTVDVAEPAVAVIDALHGRGVGRQLLRAITRHARTNGIARFRAHALADNARILQILAASWGVLVERDGPVVVYEVDIRAKEVAPRERLEQLSRATIG